jgi:hypothetical protein
MAKSRRCVARCSTIDLNQCPGESTPSGFGAKRNFGEKWSANIAAMAEAA